MNYQVNKKENIYFGIRVVASIVIFVFILSKIHLLFSSSISTSLITLYTMIVYAMVIVLFLFFQKVYLVAFMKGNGVNISEKQFSEVYSIYTDMCNVLKLKRIPKLFVLQQGGLLNAFAIRFSGNNYIAIYSDVFEMMNSDIDTLKYIIGHELGHVKRMHMSKRFWTLLSSVVPFLSSAYSRSCEYTCDNIGLAVSSSDCRRALVLLAAGKNLYKQVDIENLILDSKSNNTLSVKIMGCFMSHPYLPKRIENLERILNRKA